MNHRAVVSSRSKCGLLTVVQKLLAGLLALTLTACSDPESKLDSAATASPQKQATDDPGRTVPAGATAVTWDDESEYIVTAIADELVRLAVYSASARPPAKDKATVQVKEKPTGIRNAPQYEITVNILGKSAQVDVSPDFSTPIWAPEMYRPLLEACFDLPGGKPNGKDTATDDSADPDLVKILPAATSESLVELSAHFSAALEKEFHRGLRHEQAALILGNLALRDFSGAYYNARPVMNRMTAHLAFASALGSDASASGEGALAKALLHTLMNRQRYAQELMEALPNDKNFAPWKRILKARNTGDFRELESIPREDCTPLEYTSWFEARCRVGHVDLSWEKADIDEENALDLTRIAQRTDYSVEIGHVLLRTVIALELDQVQKIHLAYHGTEVDKEAYVDVLNTEPDGLISDQGQLNIIGWGIWADYLQRHLCNAMTTSVNFALNKWNVTEAAVQIRESIDGPFSGLTLYPFVLRKGCLNDAEYRQSVEDGFDVAAKVPHLVPVRCWARLYYWYPEDGQRYTPPNAGRADFSDWHYHNPPPGTVYDVAARTGGYSMTRIPDALARFDQLLEAAPWETTLVDGMIREKVGGSEMEYAERLHRYKAAIDYSLKANVNLAEMVGGDSEKYEYHMLRAARLDPFNYLPLGEHFEESDPEKAVRYYQLGVDECPDRVQVSNHCSWLVFHYFDNGKKQQAYEIADEMGEVYSYPGLELRGELLFQDERYDESLEMVQAIGERYGYASLEAVWYARYQAKTGDKKYNDVVEAMERASFPNGMEKVTFADFKGAAPPTSGTELVGESAKSRAAGLRDQDVIVALNGTRVEDMSQYLYARSLLPTPEMHFIVWNGREYVERHASLRDHRFGVDLDNYLR